VSPEKPAVKGDGLDDWPSSVAGRVTSAVRQLYSLVSNG